MKWQAVPAISSCNHFTAIALLLNHFTLLIYELQ
jgi:hypothetical protein